MTYNKIPVAFGALRKITGPALQWQYNEKQILVINGLELPNSYAVDFCNKGDTDTVTMPATAEGVEIPDQFLLTGRPLTAYIVVVDGESVNTIGEITFPVNVRGRRTDISPEQVEQQQIDALIGALNDGVTRAEDAAEQAEEAAELLTNPSAEATTLEPGEPATAEYDDGVFRFGIPKGDKGDKLTYADLTEADKADLVQGPILEAKTAAVQAVNTAGDTQTNRVNQAGSTQVASVNQAGTTQTGNVNRAGTDQVAAVNAAGAAQVQAVEDKGDEVLDSIPADYSALTAEVDDLTRQLSDVEESLKYVEVHIPWHVSSNYPTGWKTGYYTGNVGSEVTSSSSSNYLSAQYGISREGTGYYPAINEALFIEVTPPSDKCVRIMEVDRTTSLITRIVGEINSTTYPELQGVTQRIDVRDGYEYRVALGRFSGDSTSYNTEEYISGIKFRFVVAKKDEKYKPDTSTGSQSNVDKKQYFSVTVDRPLAFGGEETNTTKETVEGVLLLPDSYRVEGDPVPLVLMCHGASGYIQESTGTWYNTHWKTFTNALSEAGFALFDVNVLPTSIGTEQMGYCVGSPLAVNVAKAAYDYVTKNYNVQKKILVHGTSMGGVLASAFVKAYPQICLAQSSFAGRDLIHYIYSMTEGTFVDAEKFAVSYGYTDYASLVADKFSHAEGLTQSLTLKKYTSGVASLPPDRETAFQAWLDYFSELESHGKDDVIGDYTAYRSVPYKSWNSWADNVGCTKAEQILQKAYSAGGSAPYLCVYYDTGTHTEMSYGQINNMIPQLIAWFNRWLH